MPLDTTEARQRQQIRVRGTVQGVGFRPFVHRLAGRHGLAGWVLNDSAGVEIEVEGTSPALAGFLRDLQTQAPPLAKIEGLEVAPLAVQGTTVFEIQPSRSIPGAAQPVPPDTAACDDCRRELFDPLDRRYRYPFTNCTNCGPRFTIIQALPYDRPNTTMRGFRLCPDCAREYHDPADRRYHAQPVACPACGPRLWLEVETEVTLPGPGHIASTRDPERALAGAVELLRRGRIVALKGLGGFHLACDARDEAAVSRLRARKRRGPKPFAVMFPDPGTLAGACALSAEEAALLTSPRRPIVLVPARAESQLAPSVAPGLGEVGVMLPSTPLHDLLLHEVGAPLVMTSGNLSEEPIAAENEEARARLGGIADAFLLHDRPISSRYDDSVARVFAGAPVLVRRARGYAPAPLDLPRAASRPVLACGAHLKNTICLVRGQHAFLSQHLGDLENLETLAHFQATVELYQNLFAVHPEVVAHDLHPEYLSTKYALGLAGVEHVGVQHHHAHIVSCLAEHAWEGPAIGVAYDGLGYGTDGHLWGGEVLIADWRGFRRRAHLREAPLPGGEAAIRHPYRMALGYLGAWFAADLSGFAPFLEDLDARETALTFHQVQRGLNAPPTSSCGRLFDAMAALLGVRGEARYEAQAAMELQAVADPSAPGSYPHQLRDEGGVITIDPAPLLWAAYQDRQAGVPVGVVARRFHRAVADFTAAVCRRLSAETGLHRVALAGGVFQNTLLLGDVVARLHDAGLEVAYNRMVPTNDGGISFGQAVIAQAMKGESDLV